MAPINPSKQFKVVNIGSEVYSFTAKDGTLMEFPLRDTLVAYTYFEEVEEFCKLYPTDLSVETLTPEALNSILFVAAPIVSTGAQDTIPHGLGKVPVGAVPVALSNAACLNGLYGFVVSTPADDTNIYITATAGLVYTVMAF